MPASLDEATVNGEPPLKVYSLLLGAELAYLLFVDGSKTARDRVQ